MKFYFRLQKILDYRLKIEEEKKNNFAAIVSQINNLKYEIDKVLKLKQDIVAQIEKNFDISYLIYSSKAINGIYQTIDNNKRKISELEKKLEEAREEYLKARRDRMVIERMKEKKYAEYMEEVKRNEKRAIEEVAIKMWNDKTIKEFEWT